MTKESIKKSEVGQELRIVDLSERRRASARRSAAVLLVSALVLGLSFTALAGVQSEPPVDVDEPQGFDGGDPVPWEKLPPQGDGGQSSSFMPDRLPW